jgi:prepilin-type N-terminal cleavage/methylation domain-containing protein
MALIRNARARRGFSLVEILIAIAIIGIMLAVALPRLLGSREASGDSAAQQQINTVVLAATTSFTTRENFDSADALSLQDDVPEVQLVSGAAGLVPDTSVRQVSVATAGSPANEWVAAALGGEGRCWYIKLEAAGNNQYAVSPADANNTTCNAAALVPVPGAWNDFAYPAAE